jgi:hypothetical protein
MNQNREGELFDGEREILKELEEAYLTAYPNPERLGCPSPTLIEQLVSGQIRPPVGSEIVHHLTHCSPCFGVFIDARNTARSRRKRKSLIRRAVAIAAVAAFVAVAAIVTMWNRPPRQGGPPRTAQNTPNAADVASIRLDLQSYSLERGDAGQNQASNIVRPTLPRKAVKLNLALPIGFEDGPYEIRVSRTEDGPALLESRGTAHLIDNTVQLETSLDLTNLAPGTYFFGMRHAGMTWAHVQVLVK